MVLTWQAVDPHPFLKTVKDLDGNPIDVSVQQDAQGFLLDLFDKMEVRLCTNCVTRVSSKWEYCPANEGCSSSKVISLSARSTGPEVLAGSFHVLVWRVMVLRIAPLLARLREEKNRVRVR